MHGSGLSLHGSGLSLHGSGLSLHGSGMSQATAVSPKPSFRAPRREVDAVVGREMLDGQHQRVDIPAHARTAHKGLLQKRMEEKLR